MHTHIMRLLLLGAAAALAGASEHPNYTAAAHNSSATPQTAPAQGAAWIRGPIWSLDPLALAAAGCSEDVAKSVKLCETRKQASFFHARGMSAAEEWCFEVYVTVPCWPPCFCNHTNTSNSGYPWAKKHLEAQTCTALPQCTVHAAVAQEAETEARPALAASPRACKPGVDARVLSVVLALSALWLT